MITDEQAHSFANDWINAWNTHDLDRVLSHSDEDVEYFSAFSIKLTGNESGVIHGK